MTAESGAAFFARVNPTVREEKVWISLRPDLFAKHEAAEEALAEAMTKAKGDGRMNPGGDSPKTKQLAKAVADIEEEIRRTAALITFHPLPKDEWQALSEKHAPREKDAYDQLVGYNRDAVLNAAVRLCMVDPVFEDCTEKDCDHTACASWQRFEKQLNPQEWDMLRQGVNTVNAAVTDDPKSVLASQVLAKRGNASRSRARGT